MIDTLENVASIHTGIQFCVHILTYYYWSFESTKWIYTTLERSKQQREQDETKKKNIDLIDTWNQKQKKCFADYHGLQTTHSIYLFFFIWIH